VSEDAEFGTAETGGIDDTGMDEFIEDDNIVLADQSADGSEGGDVAG
jgi:hypothetical protein